MIIYTEYILLYFSITILSGYFDKCAHFYSQESLVRDSATQTTDGDLIVRVLGSTSSASLRLVFCDPEGSKHF
jgi:hypothetical protein